MNKQSNFVQPKPTDTPLLKHNVTYGYHGMKNQIYPWCKCVRKDVTISKIAHLCYIWMHTKKYLRIYLCTHCWTPRSHQLPMCCKVIVLFLDLKLAQIYCKYDIWKIYAYSVRISVSCICYAANILPIIGQLCFFKSCLLTQSSLMCS